MIRQSKQCNIITMYEETSKVTNRKEEYEKTEDEQHRDRSRNRSIDHSDRLVRTNL
jgi:hypothetical protein